MQNWEYCAVYQITQSEGWLTGVGMTFKSDFFDNGATREVIEHNPNALAATIAELGKAGWEMVGTGVVTEHYHSIYFKRPIEA